MVNPETSPAAEPIIVITRTFDAPRDLVWQAWTDPEHLAQWWGPHGFTSPRVEVDLRAGGSWEIDMQGPDGTVYPNKGTFLEVVPPERIVISDVVEDGEAWGDTPPPNSVQTITFDETNGGSKTKFTNVIRLQSLAARDAMLEMGAELGWNESLDKLAEHLTARSV